MFLRCSLCLRVFFRLRCSVFFFFFNDTATTEIYTLSLHDALPILFLCLHKTGFLSSHNTLFVSGRSEEHTSELQSLYHLVCRLLLEKKNDKSLRTLKGLNHKARCNCFQVSIPA